MDNNQGILSGLTGGIGSGTITWPSYSVPNSNGIARIAAALVKAQSEMGNATKESKNPFFKSSYANLNSVREATLPALNRNGIAVLQPVNGDVVTTILLHESGEQLTSNTKIVCAKQNDPQAYGSAVSYARRYGLQSMVCIGAEDDDAETAVVRESKPIKVATVTTTAAPNTASTVSATPIKNVVESASTEVSTTAVTVPRKGWGAAAAANKVTAKTTTTTVTTKGDLF
jgi:hypothetical protein